MDVSSLTDDQQLALQQYTAITDQDVEAAIVLLRKCQWNPQIAITRFFDGDAEVVNPAAEAAHIPAPQTSRRTETLIDNIPARSSSSRSRQGGLEPAPRVVPTPENQLVQPLPFPFSIILMPFNLTYVLLARIFGTVGYLFPYIPRLLSRFYSGRASQPSRDAGRRPLSPRDTAARFMREFEEEYGVTHGTVPFFEGGYAQAYDVAKRNLKYLIVILLSPEHDDTASFVKDTLLAPEFLAFLTNPTNQIVLWGGTVNDAEAYQAATALNATRFPYTCLIVNTPSVSSTSMSRVAGSSGPVTAQALMRKLQGAMQTHSQELDRVRQQREEQQATRNLRQEQESAYERSLAQDREKARKRREEAEAQEKAEREDREEAERKADQARKLAQWRRWRVQTIPSEPEQEGKDIVRISLRLVNGERVIRKFQPTAQLEELYAFVECYPLLQDGAIDTEKVVVAPEGYDHHFGFQLVSPMPREVFDLEKGGTLRDRIGRSGNLIVERIVGEDDELEDEEDEE